MRAEADVSISGSGRSSKGVAKNRQAIGSGSFGELLESANSRDTQPDVIGAPSDLAISRAGAGKRLDRHGSNEKCKLSIEPQPKEAIVLAGPVVPQPFRHEGARAADGSVVNGADTDRERGLLDRNCSFLHAGIREVSYNCEARSPTRTPGTSGLMAPGPLDSGGGGAGASAPWDGPNAVEAQPRESSPIHMEKMHRPNGSFVRSLSDLAQKTPGAIDVGGDGGIAGGHMRLTQASQAPDVADSQASPSTGAEGAPRTGLLGHIESCILSACSSKLPNVQHLTLVVQNGVNENVRIAMTMSDGAASIEISATADTARSLEGDTSALCAKLADATGLAVGISVLTREPDHRPFVDRQAQHDLPTQFDNRGREEDRRGKEPRADRQHALDAAPSSFATPAPARGNSDRGLLL